MTKLLVVDDDPSIGQAMRINFRARGYSVSLAGSGGAALEAAAALRPDVVILDLGLPDVDGLEVVRGIRGWSTVPILVLSARSTGVEKVQALDAGADDYVTKPFDMDELVARIRAATRRAKVTSGGLHSRVVRTASFEIDLGSGVVTRDGLEVRLSPTEWHLLEILARHSGRLMTQQQLLSDVWGPGRENQSNYLRVYMAALRRKLERDPAHPRHLITVSGIGYRLDAEDPARPEARGPVR